MKHTVAFLLVIVSPTLGLTQPGTLDPTFGIGGTVLLNISANPEVATGVLPMADGRLLVCGYTTPFPGYPEPFILRLLPNGTVDPDYGIVELSCGERGQVRDMAFAPDSSVYLCGYADTLSHEPISLWHVLPDGTPDAAFGFNGRASLSMAGDFRISDMAVQADGKVLLAGYIQVSTRNSLLTRSNPDGTPDGSFNAGNIMVLDNSINQNDEFQSVDVLDDGSIVVGGLGTTTSLDEYPVLMKFDTSGVPDPTFDGDGTLLPITGQPYSRIVGVCADGQHILAAGARAMTIASTSDYYLLRVDATGTLDPAFGTLGEQVTDVSADDFIEDMTLLNDGRIVLTGFAGDVTNGVGPVDFLTAVHNADGSLHATFGGAGYVVTATSTELDRGFAVKAQPDGKLVVAGVSNSLVAVLRYENDLGTGLMQDLGPAVRNIVYPVPFEHELTLSGTQSGEPFWVFDATGRIMLSGTTRNERTVISTTHFAPGAYVVRAGTSVVQVLKR